MGRKYSYKLESNAKMRILEESDFTETLRIFSEVFEEEELDVFLSSWIERRREVSYGIFTGESMEGFTLVRNQHIEFIGVDPKAQGKGLGTHLLHKVMEDLEGDITLIPLNDEKIIHWYKKNGFQIESVSVRNGVREILMRLRRGTKASLWKKNKGVSMVFV
jgi:ribosomal protein S18 acetylase RimI-like enzyme